MLLSNIVSLNVKGALNHAKRKKISLQLQYDTEIILMQETHCSVKSEVQFKRDFHMKEGFFSHGSTAARGVANLLNIKDEYTMMKRVFMGNSRNADAGKTAPLKKDRKYSKSRDRATEVQHPTDSQDA